MADTPPLPTGSSARALFAQRDYRHFWMARFCDLLAVQAQDLRGARLPADLSKVKHNAKTRWPEGAGP